MDKSVSLVKGIGVKSSLQLRTGLGVYRIRDLLRYYPVDYEYYVHKRISSISDGKYFSQLGILPIR